MRKLVATIAAAGLLFGVVTSADATTATTSSIDRLRVERAFQRLGLPVGSVDNHWTDETRRATCMWRELTGRRVSRSLPTDAELRPILETANLLVPKDMVTGININLTCGAATWVSKGWYYRNPPRPPAPVIPAPTATPTSTPAPTSTATASPTANDSAAGSASPTATATATATATPSPSATPTRVWGRYVRRVMQVSTGMPGYQTRIGIFKGTWRFDGWWQSTIYPDGKMYRPIFFNGGQALHGSLTDDLVHWYPASHGCVRMLHSDIDALWAGGVGHGTPVRVYGVWKY